MSPGETFVAEVALLVQQAFGLTILLLLPLVAAAAVSATAAGMLAARLGINDPTVTLVARALALVLALGLTLDALTQQTLSFTTTVWDRLGEVGRAGRS